MPVYTSLYLHIPFCTHRCAYCDFNTYAGQDRYKEDYVNALCQEMEMVSREAPNRIPVHTIFLGGGTPSLLQASHMDLIFRTIYQNYDIQADAEISLEANPGTVNPKYLQELRALGFNRISLGVQSAHPDDLRVLERQHTYLDVIRSVEWARKAGFTNLNLDLMFGLPGQTLERWNHTLDLILGLSPDHLSLYALTLEHGTPFQRWTEKGLIPVVDEDLAADMYETARDRLSEAGYEHYEISNWALVRSGGEAITCKHNLQYWRDLPYLGFGAGAHGYADGVRTANVLGIPAYINRLKGVDKSEFPVSPAAITVTKVDQKTEAQEFMMVGLRLVKEGVSAREFKRRIGKPIQTVFGDEIEKLDKAGLLEWYGNGDEHLRLTRKGQLLGNRVFMEFVGE